MEVFPCTDTIFGIVSELSTERMEGETELLLILIGNPRSGTLPWTDIILGITVLLDTYLMLLPCKIKSLEELAH